MLTKCDLATRPPEKEPPSDAVSVSGLTGQGLDTLRQRVIETFGLTEWRSLCGPFTRAQTDILITTAGILSAMPPNLTAARANLNSLVAPASDGDPPVV